MMEKIKECGKIKIFLGPMFAGKSIRLINTIKKCIYENKKIVYITHYNNINSSDKYELKNITCLKCNTLNEIFNELLQFDVIGIDEAHYFSDLVEVCEKLSFLGKQIYVAALNGDYKMEPFNNVTKLISICDIIKLMKAFCYYCDNNAKFTIKVNNQNLDENININNLNNIPYFDIYKPVCKSCFYRYSKKNVI
jgi:thymidine kinase